MIVTSLKEQQCRKIYKVLFSKKTMDKKEKPKVRVDTKPSGIESAVIYSPFDEAYESLTEKGYEIISLPQNAQLRIKEGADSPISKNGNWTREGVLYVPGEKPRLIKNSPLLQWRTQAIEAYKNGEEFSPTRWQDEQYLIGSIEFPQDYTEISIDKLDSEALTIYAFGGKDEARNYGEFLRNEKIMKVPIWVVPKEHVNSQKWPFVRQMWFWYLDYRSGLDGSRNINPNSMRGIKMNAETKK